MITELTRPAEMALQVLSFEDQDRVLAALKRVELAEDLNDPSLRNRVRALRDAGRFVLEAGRMRLLLRRQGDKLIVDDIVTQERLSRYPWGLLLRPAGAV